MFFVCFKGVRMITFRRISTLLMVGLVGWLGLQIYTYFFSRTLPKLDITGIENGQYCSGDVQCFVFSDKTGDLSLWLDEQPLTNKFKITANEAGHPFVIPTQTMTNGIHSFRAELIDKTFHHNTTIVKRSFHVDNVPLQAAFIKSGAQYKKLQGRTLHVKFQANKEIKEAKIRALAHAYNCFPESKNSSVYECFIPIACEEQPNEYLFSVDLADRVGNTLHLDNKFQVVQYPFKRQTIHVKAEKIEQEKTLGRVSKELEQELFNIVKNSPQEKLWHGTFCTPIDIDRVTCEFGTVRTTQNKGRYAHKALDIINTPKSVVWSPQEGIVVLKDRFASSGNTVVIDHGWGVLSLFFHLHDFADIEVGQKLVQGNPIGQIGKTGEATGYHLHWEMRVDNVAVDPMQWTKTTF